jgi:formylglycine-generating enzyme required for sulfatase activity
MNRKTLFTGISAAMLVLFSTCDAGLHDPGNRTSVDGKVVIPIRVQNDQATTGRSVLPQFSLWEVTRYELLGSTSGEEIVLTSFTYTWDASVTLDTGTWNFTLNGYKDEALFLQGKIKQKLISSSEDSLDFFVMPPITDGQGSMTITINLPAHSGIASVTVFKDTVELSTLPVTSDTIVYTESPVDAGDYFMHFALKNSSNTIIAIVSELVLVRADMPSEKTIPLQVEDLKFIAIVPTGLAATLQEDNSIQLDWNVLAGVDSYCIYRSDAYDGIYNFINTSTSSPYTDTSVASFTTYYYKVSAVNNNHVESAWSDYTSGTTLHAAPITINPGQDWDLLSQTQSVMKDTAHEFSVNGTYTAYQWYLEGELVETDSTYTFDATGKAGGDVYELVVVVTSSSGEQRSGICRITVIPEDMVYVAGGTFMMGSPESEPGRDSNEIQHEVTVSSFYMGRYEVTKAEYEAVMGGYFSSGAKPVESVTWYDAIAYCNARSEREGLTLAYTIDGTNDGTNVIWNQDATGYRLPTEAEWEYACRGGTMTAFSTGDNITTDQANYYGEIYRGTAIVVGRFAANSLGLYDMHGNLSEWCWDWYGDYDSGAQIDPVGASSGTDRVRRGGSWNSYGQYLRSASRNSDTPSYWTINLIGFRLARSRL